jgi:NodT family efflux transporter outer membrane factor (OMF) lipoprotein
MRRAARSVAGVALLGLAACAVGPDHEAPTFETGAEWGVELPEGFALTEPDIERWWEIFGDPVLVELVDRARSANRELEVAASRVLEASHLRAAATGDYGPRLAGTAGFERSRLSQNSILGNFIPGELDNWSVGLEASWEIDLFGRVRRSVESADAELGLRAEDFLGVAVSLTAEVAIAYADYRGLQRRVELATQNRDLQRSTLELTRARFEAGLTGELDVAQARVNLATTAAAIPTLRARALQAETRLAVLIGIEPARLREVVPALGAPGAVPAAPDAIAVGLPADLLRRRPDVRAAERAVAAACARIGVQAAELYPQLSLNGSIGLESLEFDDWIDSGSRTYAFGPALRWNLFQTGRLEALVRAAEEAHRQTLATWEQQVLVALGEVRDSIGAFAEERQRRTNLVEAVAAATQAVAFAQERYVQGVTDFQNVLDAQRTLASLQDQLASSEVAVATNVIALYRALGGGWAMAPAEPGDG